VACIDKRIDLAPGQIVMIDSGISINMMNIPEDCMAILVPRSGKGCKGLGLKNFTGILDKDYHGPIKMAAWNTNDDTYITIDPLERIAQLIFVPIIKPNFNVVEEFNQNTERGEGGFGHSGSH
jgi:dUTP pyrophosphatase